jgi:hypothetical protein
VTLEVELAITAILNILRIIMLNFGMLLSKVQPNLLNVHVFLHLLNIFSEIEDFGFSFLQPFFATDAAK